MAQKTIMGGSVLRVTEYEVRLIDEYGDATDVEHYETKGEAIAAAAEHLTSVQAVVVERHISYHPSRYGEDRYTTVHTAGSEAALRAGGWID